MIRRFFGNFAKGAVVGVMAAFITDWLLDVSSTAFILCQWVATIVATLAFAWLSDRPPRHPLVSADQVDDEDENMRKIVAAAWNTGEVVSGHVREDGKLDIRFHGRPDNDR